MLSREEKPFPKPAARPKLADSNRNGALGPPMSERQKPSSSDSLPASERRRPGSNNAPRLEQTQNTGYAAPVAQRLPPRVAQSSHSQGAARAPMRSGAALQRAVCPPSMVAAPQATTDSSAPPRRRKGRSAMTQVKVFVRWRPLVGDEVKRGDSALIRTCDRDNGVASISITSDRTRVPTWKGAGFAGVFQDHETNAEVFELAVAPLLGTILRGKSACCFCYGHTGSGKTHTVLGYGSELGLYRLGAASMFEAFAALEEQPPGGLQLSVRFAELHNDRAFDLMDGRAECRVREDADGQVHFRKDPTILADGSVRVRPMSSIRCNSAEDVAAAVAAGSSLRAVGSSSLHSQSSRSHAILEMEVVSEELLAARESAIHEESLLVPLGKMLEELNFNAAQGQDVDPEQKAMLGERVMAQSEVVDAARERVAQVLLSTPCLGGTLVLVDLAGAEHGAEAASSGRKQSQDEIREGKEINTSSST
eukprot:TRINITY_DN56746_c0_g1_i1.p1 TRINITY_DN56746_c0_g1~~TRINITY_DN56746_c0_g1_i1.p1  ORF type:complete len:479 (-),score=48.75 TRINITY_DN56746_c0_g1_i1:274-1710(-)